MTETHTIGSVRIAYDLHGDAGPPVVFLSPMASHRRCWAPQIKALRTDCQLLTLDHRGIGDSSCAPQDLRGLTVRQMAEDALAVVDAVGWARFHLVGMSMGGAVGQEMALLAGDRLVSLTLIATAAKYPSLPLRGAWHFAWHCVGLILRLRWLSARHLVALLHTPAWRRGHSTRALADHWGPPAPLSVVLAQARAVGQHNTLERLGALDVPTRIFTTGAHDAFIDDGPQAALCAAIPEAKRVRFEDSGHAITVEEEDAVNAALRRLILAFEAKMGEPTRSSDERGE